jgi:hypothetical protein
MEKQKGTTRLREQLAHRFAILQRVDRPAFAWESRVAKTHAE